MNYECSAEGFRRKGWKVERFEDVEEVDLQEGQIIHGPIEDVHEFVDIDDVVGDYPKPLQPFLNRDVEKTTLEEVHGELDVFVKPVEHKLFTGFCVTESFHWAQTKRLPGDTEVYTSDIIEMDSEYRVYVGDDEIKHIGRYRGDAEKLPEVRTIHDMIDAWDDSPAAYALDVAVTPQYKTILVEVNPMMTSGVYGVDPITLVELLKLVWEEYWE